MKATQLHKSGGKSGKVPERAGPMARQDPAGAASAIPAAVGGYNQGNTMPNPNPDPMAPNYK